MYCIYCNDNHDEATAFSDEHIIPRALGGLSNFTVRVCEKSNSQLGDRVDGPFIRMFPVNSDRFFLNIPSYRGRPTLDFGGTMIIDGEDRPLRYEVTGSEKLLKLKPSVDVVKTDTQEALRISGDPMDVKNILLGKLASVEAVGKKLRDELGNVVTKESIEIMIAERSVIHENPSVLMTLHIDPYDAVRFFCKLALATGFYVLGEAFGRSARGQRLRTTMISENDKIEDPGPVWPFIQGEPEVFRFFRVPDAHVLAIFEADLTALAISLFGGKYTALIPLRDKIGIPGRFRPDDGRVFQIELQTRQLTQSSYRDYLLKKPWAQEAASKKMQESSG